MLEYAPEEPPEEPLPPPEVLPPDTPVDAVLLPPEDVLPDDVLPDDVLPEPDEEPPTSTDVLPAPPSELLPEFDVESLLSFTFTLVLPAPDVDTSVVALSSLLPEELPPSRLENTYPLDAANDSAAELLYP